jgi:DNA-binding transcriptional MerR regulator
MTDDLVTSLQASRILRRHRSTINDWARDGLLTPALTLDGGQRLFHRADIERIARAQDAKYGIAEAPTT